MATSCITVCFTYSLRMAIFLNTDISQGSVATRLGCGGIFVYDFVANFLLSLTVKEFWKSVNIWWSYGQELGVLFFLTHSVYIHNVVLGSWKTGDKGRYMHFTGNGSSGSTFQQFTTTTLTTTTTTVTSLAPSMDCMTCSATSRLHSEIYTQYNTHTHTHTHTRLTALCPGLPGWAGTRKVNQSGFYSSKRQWVAVASAGPYASLHLAPDR